VAYAKGELVEPIKYRLLYDPATPEKLRKYIKQGIEEWQNHLKLQVLKRYYCERPTNERRRSLVQRI
jgi:predicted transcriptional regulator